MKNVRFLFVITATLVGGLLASTKSTQQNWSAEVLLGTALHQEEVEGKLEAAIETYRKFLAEYPDNRPLAAKALLHMGQCYEKLGNAEARKAYERLVRDYADQSEQARLARTRLSALGKPPGGASGMISRKIWAGPGIDIEGAVSPDGTHLSYTDWDTGDLAIRDLQTGTSHRLTNKGSWYESSAFAEFSAISPDGRQIAYGWYGKDFSADLRLIGIDGSKPRVLYSDSHLSGIQAAGWSPDGKYVLTTFYGKDSTNQIALVSVAGDSVRILKTLGWRMPIKPAISPDGRYVAYDFPVEEDSPERDISVLSIDSKQETALIEHPANDVCPVWTPDGKRILFASDRTGSMSFWVLRVADGKAQGPAELIKQDVGRRILPMGFTREGNLYFGLETAMEDVYIASLDFKTGKLLAAPKRATERFVGCNSAPDWSPDGRQLAYISHRDPMWEGSFVVCIKSLETGEERDLAPKLAYIFTPRWSPDGRTILLAGRSTRNRMGLYLMDVKSGNLTPLVQRGDDEQIPLMRAAWSRDGKSIFYVRGRPGTTKSGIVARELDTGLEKEIFSIPSGSTIPLSTIEISPGGQWIAFRSFDETTRAVTIKVAPSSGGTARELVREEKGENIPGFSPLAWSPDGLQVLFTKGSSDPQDWRFELWRVPVDGAKPQKVPVQLATHALYDVRVHPDGQRIALSAGQRTDAGVWVMENFLTPGNPK